MAEAAASLKGGGSEVKGGEESKDITDLFGLIETQTLECLNQDNAHPLTHCLGQVRAPSPIPNSTFQGRLQHSPPLGLRRQLRRGSPGPFSQLRRGKGRRFTPRNQRRGHTKQH